MEPEKIIKTISIIKDIEKKNREMEEFLSNLTITSRNDLLKEITNDIIEKNSIIKEHGFSKENLCVSETESSELISISSIIDNLVSNIQKNPSKKVLYLRLFLDRFHDISDQDKNVLIQSVKDETSEGLKEKMLSLITVFKLEV
jgi:hypothetical protein